MLLEKISTTVLADSREVNLAVAQEIAALIREKAARNQKCVLGLATGSTPTGVYEQLVRLHKEGLSFKNVITFNLDEYFPMQKTDLQSYHRFMHEWLFDRIDILPENIHIPDGTIAPEAVNDFCKNYEQQIKDAGGIDLQLLGIGRTGHIGFNEPGSSRDSRTRLITLDRVTRNDAASDFFGEQYVPRRAITMGVGTILTAKKIILIAFGEGKSPVVARAVEGSITLSVAASFLQEHGGARFMLDEAAAAELTRFKSPWLLGNIEWPKPVIKKAVIWLSRHVKKPILKLTEEDYNEHGLQDLVATVGRAYDINIDVFRQMSETITGWPGGKPAGGRTATGVRNPPVTNARGPENAKPSDDVFPKTVLVFSPHPDDDVISMGGTLIRLVDQKQIGRAHV